MKIFIIEDDLNVVKILKQIIRKKELGNVVGYSLKSIDVIEDIKILEPDIILIDLLMPDKDGLSLMREIKKENDEIHFIMISQVSEKQIIGKAYSSGVDYYISKPINAVEVENVIKKEIKQIKRNKIIGEINQLVDNSPQKEDKNYIQNKIKKVMNDIGILGETGSKDIINICKYLVKNDLNMSEHTIKEICSKVDDNYKAVEQRIRRTALKGLRNLASLGLEDYMNETFRYYANGLYSFKEVKTEMDKMRGKTDKNAKINFKKFIDGLIFYGLQR
ncbi:MAG: DNA-binding domain-containing protein [Halanaerobiales bacterium]